MIVSVKPLHSLAAAVLDGLGEPQLLVDGAASPHSFELRPSQARALQDADLLVLVGAGLEPFEARLERPAERRVIRMSDLSGIRLRPLGTPGPADGHDAHEGHAEEGAGIDPHLWLDPANMSRLAAEIAGAMIELDPENADTYEANLERVEKELAVLDRSIEERLESYGERPFVVGHDAYGYFTSRYGLRQAGVVALAPERGPGARTLRALRARVEELAPVCVFREPGLAPDLLQTIADGVAVEFGELDPLGVGLPAGPDHYPTMMRGLAGSFVDCLSRLPPQGG
ncbi:MAG: zinc ABC transporter substrate-binding protein [Geminicoccaceae bacterium]|nr:zinc ABC transporter substrate-binding protein [Geminicoccaceae bacterium]